MSDFLVNGIVSQRDKQPYIQLSNEKGMIAQLTVGQARTIAQDILVMASRCEADAMLIKFFEREEFPAGASSALLIQFREFRAGLDDDQIEHTHRGEVEG